MLHRRLLDSLDSSSPLLFLEAVYGSGKRTALQQWEDRGGHRHGEIRLRFSARGLPDEPAALLRMFWSALGSRLEQTLPELPAEDDRVDAAAQQFLPSIRRPIAVAIHGADHFTEGLFEAWLGLLEAGVRLVIAGYDLSAQIATVQRRGLYFSLLRDRDIWLSLEESRVLAAEEGVDLDEEAAAALFHATWGHPGMLLAALHHLPVETAAGVLTRDRAIAAVLTEEPPARRPSEFATFLATTVLLSRFTAHQAAVLSGRADASHLLSRLQGLVLGRMVWHPGLQERVFRWDERVRRVLEQSVVLPAEQRSDLDRRIVAAARVSGDEELLIAALVQVGELDRAEEVLRERVWDLLPNAMASLWSPLERISPLALLERPALLSARLRLSPHRSHSVVSAQAARRAGRALEEASDGGSPWTRVGQLAGAMDLALYAGERERLIDLFGRVRTLAGDLVASDVAATGGGRAVSDLLLIAEVAFRSGNAIPAAEIAGLAAQLIEFDPEQLDPRGERLAFARRLILHDRRARGVEDLVDPEPLLSAVQFLWRDADIVAAEMSLMWGWIDDGDFVAADAHLRAAIHRVADPEQWPVMMLLRANLAMIRQSPNELEEAVSAYERGTLAEPGPFAQEGLSQVRRTVDYLARVVGRPLPSPGFLPAAPEPGGLFYPRVDFVVHLMEALYALRAERSETVRAALARAVALTPRRELGLYTLANATQTEVRALCEAAEDVPGGFRLHLEKALLFAGALHRPVVALSEREHEVLVHLRDGATNPEMAQAMFVSVNTVKFHRANLMRKLDSTSRDELLEAAAKIGL